MPLAPPELMSGALSLFASLMPPSAGFRASWAIPPDWTPSRRAAPHGRALWLLAGSPFGTSRIMSPGLVRRLRA
eukprot:8947903-Alexandrium_andersonii.AAC.1